MRRLRPLLALALCLTLLPAAPPAARALPAVPTLTVNSLADVPGGGNLANGVCETAPGNGVCTLRAAVMEANHYPGGGVTIIRGTAVEVSKVQL